MSEQQSAQADNFSTQVQRLEVACAELSSLSAGRSVYEKKGNIFFHSNTRLLTNSQQRELKKLKSLAKEQT